MSMAQLALIRDLKDEVRRLTERVQALESAATEPEKKPTRKARNG